MKEEQLATEPKARIVKHLCGGIVFVSVPRDGKFSKDAKREFKAFAEPGYTFEDITIQEAREHKWCNCGEKEAFDANEN